MKKKFPREYSCWKDMRKRCNNPHCRDFKNYGGRGIRVCSRWDSFDLFISDMGPCPPGFTIDRKDNDGAYGPDNCKWSSRAQQNKNKRDNVIVEHNGRQERLCVLNERLGFSPRRIHDRLRKGWTLDEAIGTPQRKSPTFQSVSPPPPPTP